MTDGQKIAACAEALMKAFPTLREDFTEDWFRKVARVVLEAAKVMTTAHDDDDDTKQLKLALADLMAVLLEDPFTPISLAKAQFTLDMAEQMVKTKGPQWTWYIRRIEEEFGEAAK